jgi:hypothetical protein
VGVRVRGRGLGLAVMVASLSFGVLYALSFVAWAKAVASLFGREAWTWWVIALPLAAIVGFAVFFSAWVGWVMLSATESKKGELLPQLKASRAESASTGTGGRNRS